MNNEPVAWTDGRFNLSFDKTGICDIPLYTHPAKTLEPLGEKFEKVLNDNLWELMEESPAKTLTDEEILNLAKEQYGHAVGLYNHIGFAREILRKANEK